MNSHEVTEQTTLKNKVGFSCIPDQLRDKSIRDGYRLNLLVVGRRGLGCSTLVNSMFNAPLVSKKRGNGLTSTENEIVENSIKLKLGVTTVHDLNDHESITTFINDQFSAYLKEERLVFDKIIDKRIHCCIFMLPTDVFKDDELELLHKIAKICNVIPVIAKGDSYTVEELEKYQSALNSKVNLGDLFAPIMTVSASEEVHDINGVQMKGRRYPWGFVAIEEILEFTQLQRMIVFENHMDLKRKTDVKFYQEYRNTAVIGEEEKKEMFEKLREQMDEIMEEKYTLKLELLKKEEIDIEKFLSATKLAKGNVTK